MYRIVACYTGRALYIRENSPKGGECCQETWTCSLVTATTVISNVASHYLLPRTMPHHTATTAIMAITDTTSTAATTTTTAITATHQKECVAALRLLAAPKLRERAYCLLITPAEERCLWNNPNTSGWLVGSYTGGSYTGEWGVPDGYGPR